MYVYINQSVFSYKILHRVKLSALLKNINALSFDIKEKIGIT